MKNTNNNPFIIFFALIGVFAVICGGWYLYERHSANQQAKAAFSAPPASGVPDMYHDAPAPPQP